jgi:UDP-N-acetylglucosamine 2-epimerase (non-hydrolysing)
MVKKIASVFGTRPEIIKLAELINILKKKKGVRTKLVFTGQHYDYSLFGVFMRELRLPKIGVNLGISGGTNEYQVREMLRRLLELFSEEKPDIVAAQGDTNSVAAGALAAFFSGTAFAHVEAGLRSFDNRMPEEANRILADTLSDFAFAPTKTAVRNLRASECGRESIFLTGNTIVEAVKRNLKKSAKSRIIEKLGRHREQYALLTAHRQEYVDSKKSLLQLLSAIPQIKTTVVFPVHPRTVKNLKRFGLWKKTLAVKNLRMVKPLGYFDFLRLASESMFIMSDSGGIQEEASVYKKFVIVLRDSTERPEILGKFGVLTGYNAKKIAKEGNRAIKDCLKIKKRLKKLESPFGDGRASERIAKILAGR